MKTGVIEGEDLVKVCGGYEQGAAQFDYLRRQGLRPFPGRDGHPRITWEAVNEAMSGGKKPGAQPNFDAIRKAS